MPDILISRVKIISKSNNCYDFNGLKIGWKGTLIVTDGMNALVKFDNFDNGHPGISHYAQNNMPYDRDDKSHWWIPVELIEEITRKKSRKN